MLRQKNEADAERGPLVASMSRGWWRLHNG